MTSLREIRESQGITKSRFQLRESKNQSIFLEKFGEFQYESGKQSRNFVIAFIFLFSNFSKKNSLAPSALANYKYFLIPVIVAGAVGSRILTYIAMVCYKVLVSLNWDSVNLGSGEKNRENQGNRIWLETVHPVKFVIVCFRYLIPWFFTNLYSSFTKYR